MDANERLRRAGDEAADWWALLQGENLTREEREAFVDWLRDSQTNIAEMLRLAQVHHSLEHFQRWADLSTEESSDAPRDVIPLPVPHKPGPVRADAPRAASQAAGGRSRRFTSFAAVAAVLVAALFVTTLWRGSVISTERGERREVVLDDGSVVRVDPQTRLEIRFDESARRVVLVRGRAVFHVAKDEQRPFLVRAHDTTVRAVGTAFGVEHRENDVVLVTVVEGRVAVDSEAATGAGTTVLMAGEPAAAAPLYLVADQQVSVQRGYAVAPVRGVNGARELAWAEGRLVFRNEPVAKVVEEFNRYNRVHLSVTDATLAARPVTGVFDATNPEAFIAFMQNATSVHIERDGSRSIVISAGATH